MKNNLFLIFHGRFPSEKAASIFAAKSAEAFAEYSNVTLLVPRRLRRINLDPYNFYGVAKKFKIVYLPTIDLFKLPIIGNLAFFVSYVLFSISSFIYILFKSSKDDIVYSNENLPLLFVSLISKNIFYEMHDFPNSKFYFYYKFILRRVKWVLIHNKWKADKATQVLDVSRDKIICELNAVELTNFGINISKEEARSKLEIPNNVKIVVYTGHLYGWKGANVLADASLMLPEDIMVYFVGGTVRDVQSFKVKYERKNIVFVGHRNHSEIPFWQAAADVLVIPNTAKEDISKYYTSPMKLFEYMASGRPIVASKIPSIEEIVSEREVSFFKPDDANDLARVVAYSLEVDSLEEKIQNSKEKVKKHTWQGRAGRIFGFIKSNK